MRCDNENISLPESVLDKYLLAIQKASGRPADKPVVTYDATCRLKLEFLLGTYAVFNFSPSLQVNPPLLTKHWAVDAKKEELFLPFRKLTTACESR